MDSPASSTSSNESEEDRIIVAAAAGAGFFATSTIAAHTARYLEKTPYHTSALSGQAWIRELLEGHPERIRCELGVHKHVFIALVRSLETGGVTSSHRVSIEEKLGIFLYTCVTGLSLRHVCERFQHSMGTTSKYFKDMLHFFSAPPFYNSFVRLPRADDPIPSEIADNQKFYPFFQHAIGAIDGTHINCNATAKQRQAARNRKGTLTMNCLAACTFDLQFIYLLSGWEGSTSDSLMFHDARVTDLPVLPGKYYLADAGFPNTLALVIPFRGPRYNVRECGPEHLRPADEKELFNLRHAMARNAIERIFGVLKKRFKILIVPPDLHMDLQAELPPALAAIHNFICIHDRGEIDEYLEYSERMSETPNPGEPSDSAASLQLFTGKLALGMPGDAEKNDSVTRREGIAADMWAQYQAERAHRGEA